MPEDPSGRSRERSEAVFAPTRVRRRCAPENAVGVNSPLFVGRAASDERMELSDTMLGNPMQTGQPNGVRSSDLLGIFSDVRMHHEEIMNYSYLLGSRVLVGNLPMTKGGKTGLDTL